MAADTMMVSLWHYVVVAQGVGAALLIALAIRRFRGQSISNGFYIGLLTVNFLLGIGSAGLQYHLKSEPDHRQAMLDQDLRNLSYRLDKVKSEWSLTKDAKQKAALVAETASIRKQLDLDQEKFKALMRERSER
jgi:hypothetical protein